MTDDDDVFDVPPPGPPPLPRVGDERRGWTRAPYVTPVRLLVGELHADARSLDVSEGGVLLVAREALKMGTEVLVRFAPPLSATPISLRGVARWVGARERGFGLGVGFLAVPEEVRSAIAAYAALVPRGK